MAAGWVEEIQPGLSSILTDISLLDARVDSLESGVSLDTDLVEIAGLTPANDDIIQQKAGVWTNRTVAQYKTDLTLVKADVGLGNVDNTSDATKNAASVTLTNKTVAFGSNTVSGTLAQFNTAVTDADLASIAGSETLTNKTLTSPAINGGTVASLVSLSMTTPTWSAGDVTGGRILDLSYVETDLSYTQTQNPATTFGLGFRVDWDVVFDYVGDAFVGPTANTGFFGPYAGFQFQGTHQYNEDTGIYGLAAISFQDQLFIKNEPGSTRTMTPAWQFLSSRFIAADGGAVTLSQTDGGHGAVAFTDNQLMITAGAGTITTAGDYDLVGFASLPVVIGATTLQRRVGFLVDNVNMNAAGFASILETAVGDKLTNTVSSTNATIGWQIGLQIAKLTGASQNDGIASDAPYNVWPTWTTWTAAVPLSPFYMNSVHSLNFASATFPAVFSIAPTIELEQAAHALNVFSVMSSGPTIKNDPALGGGVSTSNVLHNIVPTYQADTQTNVDFGSFTAMRVGQNLSRINSGVGHVDTLTDYESLPTINTPNTVDTRQAFWIGDPLGTGAIQYNYGLYIAAQTRGAVENLGIYSQATVKVVDAGTTNYVSLIPFGSLPTLAFGTGTTTDASITRSASGELTVGANLKFDDAKNIAVNATTGTKIGTATSQKLGFFNATPVVQQTSTTDLRTALINLGFVATGGASPLNLNGGAFVATQIDHRSAAGDTQPAVRLTTLFGTGVIQLGAGGSTATDVSISRASTTEIQVNAHLKLDAKNIVTDTSTGTQIGTATGQKLAFWAKTPIIQPASANQAAVGTTAPAGGTGTAAGGWDTAGNRNTAITTINSLVTLVNEMRTVLVNVGIMKGSA